LNVQHSGVFASNWGRSCVLLRCTTLSPTRWSKGPMASSSHASRKTSQSSRRANGSINYRRSCGPITQQSIFLEISPSTGNPCCSTEADPLTSRGLASRIRRMALRAALHAAGGRGLRPSRKDHRPRAATIGDATFGFLQRVEAEVDQAEAGRLRATEDLLGREQSEVSPNPWTAFGLKADGIQLNRGVC
jgi:hypothetical protein